MAAAQHKTNFDDPVTGHLRQDYTVLRADQTVGEALDWLRQHPPPGRIIYFYVVDGEGVLRGVVPTRRLVLSPPSALLADIMGREVTTLPARATVLEACEFFILHRLLAVPVVDENHRLVGVADIDLYTDELARLGEGKPVFQWLRPLGRFLQIESASGIVLLVCTLLALVLANSPWSAAYQSLWQTKVGLTFGAWQLEEPLLHWINDGLMTLFFFVVGLEIKRELVSGELNDWQKAMLPVMAALGGMVVPAALYLACHVGRPTVVGWGIPMATDIAFVVGFLVLLGSRVPQGLKILLLSLAIADDIGAVVVIALVYSTNLSLPALTAGFAGLGLVLFFRWIGVRLVLAYFVLGLGTWLAFFLSGVHPTVAGVVLGLLTPARPWMGDRVPFDVVPDLFKRISGNQGKVALPDRREPVSPLDRLVHTLHPWVAFLIMPLFALANAGVVVELSDLGKPVAVAVALGLILGKPLGIVLFSWGAVKLGLAQLPAGINGKVLVGAGCLAGIGFTMALFIASLALRGPDLGPHLDEAKIGILGGSTVSAVLGSLLLLRFLPREEAKPAEPR